MQIMFIAQVKNLLWYLLHQVFVAALCVDFVYCILLFIMSK